MTTAQLGKEGAKTECEEHRRLARGWRKNLEVCERLRRRMEGLPLLELVKDKQPTRTRGAS